MSILSTSELVILIQSLNRFRRSIEPLSQFRNIRSGWGSEIMGRISYWMSDLFDVQDSAVYKNQCLDRYPALANSIILYVSNRNKPENKIVNKQEYLCNENRVPPMITG